MLKKYLPAVMQYSREEAQIYVADNASTDGSLNLLAQGFPECNIIRLERNWGFAEGYNKALRQVDAEYYLLLNSDIEVTHHWLTPPRRVHGCPSRGGGMSAQAAFCFRQGYV